jgi:predicted nucleic acid-binding protein
MDQLSGRPTQLFTSSAVLAETHALLLNRLGRHVGLRFLNSMEDSATRVVRVTAADEEHAKQIIRTYDDKDFSFTDATSFAVMERLRISTAFSFDRNFAQYGLLLLRP